jgi:hypothetical protein
VLWQRGRFPPQQTSASVKLEQFPVFLELDLTVPNRTVDTSVPDSVGLASRVAVGTV